MKNIKLILVFKSNVVQVDIFQVRSCYAFQIKKMLSNFRTQNPLSYLKNWRGSFSLICNLGSDQVRLGCNEYWVVPQGQNTSGVRLRRKKLNQILYILKIRVGGRGGGGSVPERNFERKHIFLPFPYQLFVLKWHPMLSCSLIQLL